MQSDQSEKKIREFYNSTRMEEDRLEQGVFKLEKLRSQAIIQRYLIPGGMTIADIGGATGTYSFWLQREGYSVHLLDSAEAHVEMARQTGKHLKKPLDSVTFGDARSLPYADEKFDLVMVFGPLYHLQDQKDRVQTLKEARRVLKPGGIILASTITRYASLLDGFWRSLILDPDLRRSWIRISKAGSIRTQQKRQNTLPMPIFIRRLKLNRSSSKPAFQTRR